MHSVRALKVACYWKKREEMTRNERVEDKEMDDSGQQTERGIWSEIT